MRLILLNVALFISTSVFSQLETKYWYLGTGAGMVFENAGPVGDTNSPATFPPNTGAGSIADSNGNLLFYFGSNILWNANHEQMLNGSGLHTVVDSEQPLVIVPKPNSTSNYYVFETDCAPCTNGLFYHEVDMSLDGGLGGILPNRKNIQLMDSTAEKIAAVKHANGLYWWVMVHQSYYTSKYHAFLVTDTGVVTVPVTSEIGNLPTFAYASYSGSLRFNHAGTMMVNSAPTIEIFDFDAETGMLSNLREVPNSISLPWNVFGAEFSPDDSKLYVCGPNQFDVTLPTGAAIAASQVFMGYEQCNGLQLGLDGKIYGTQFINGAPSSYMSVINYPNEPGLACNFQDSAVYLLGRLVEASVPQFPSSFFVPKFYADTACVGQEVDFSINFHFIDSVQWNFGDPSSGAANTSTAVNPAHTYSTAGNYTVTLIAQNGIKSDTVIKTVTVKDVPQIDLGPDRDLCLTNPDSVKLSLGGEKGVYQWSTGSADSLVHITTAMVSSSVVENYLPVTLQYTNECGTDYDTVLVYGSEPLALSLSADTSVCDDEFSVFPTIDTLTPIVKLLWQDSSTNGTFTAIRESEIEHTKSIKLLADNACGSASDSMRVTFLSVPDGVLPNDSVHCLDEGFYLVRPNRIGITYEWENGSQDFQHYVSGTGTYGLTSYSQCDTLRDTFSVVFNGEPKSEFVNDTIVCPNETVVLSNLQHQVGQTYVWSWLSGVEATDSVLVFTPDSVGSNIISVRITLKQCSVIDSILLQIRGDCYDACLPSFANIFTPNGDGLNEQFRSGMEDCQLESYWFTVYNRWGQTVFSSTNPKLGWDGSVNGQIATEGAYFYTLDFKSKGGEMIHYQGTVEVLR